MNRLFAAEDADGQAAADDFAQRDQIGIERVELAGAAESNAKAGHDLVDDEQRAVLRGEGAQTGEIAGRGRNAAGVADDGLDDDGGNGIGMGSERGFDRGKIVVGQSKGEVGDFFRHAGRAGNAECRYAGAGFDQQAVGVAVIAALELDDDLAPGGGAGQANGRHGRLSAGADEAHLFDGRIAGDDAFGQVGLGCRGSAEAGGVARGAFNGFDNRGKGVAQNHRPPGAEVVDVAVAVRVGDPGSVGALDKRWRAAHCAKRPHRRVDPTGKKPLGALLKDLGSCADPVWKFGIHGGSV